MSKIDKLKSNWKLFIHTFLFYKRNFWTFTKVAGVVVLIGTIIKSYDLSHTNSSDIALILYLAGVYVLLALVWLNFNQKEGQKIKISQAYQLSSARFFPFLAVSLIQSLLSLLLIVGSVLIILTIGLGMLPVFILIGIVLIVLAIVLLIWYSLAGLVVVAEVNLSSIQALKRSRELVKGNFFRLLINYLVFSLIIGLVSGLVINLVTRIEWVWNNWLARGLIDGILITVILSVISIFGFNLYEDLKRSSE